MTPADRRALFFAAALLFGVGLLYLGGSHAPSKVQQSQTPSLDPTFQMN